MDSTVHEIWIKAWRALLRHKAIAIIVLAAGLLRLAGIPWGMPIISHQYNYHPDEWTYLLAIYSFPYHIVFQKYMPYPMFVPYLISVMSPFNLFLGTIANTAKLIMTGNKDVIDAIWITYKVMGRFVIVLMGTASVALAYALGRRLFGSVCAFVSAIFVAFSLYALQNASFFTPGVASSFFMLLTMMAAYRIYDRPDFLSYGLTAIAMGALAGTMYPAFVGAAFVLVIHVQASLKHAGSTGERMKFLFGARLWFLIGASVAAFLVLSPGTAVHFGDAVKSVVEELGRASNTMPTSRWDPYAWLDLGLKNIELLGPPFAALAAIAFIWNIARLDRKSLPLIVVPILCWAAFVSAMRPRHMLLILPLYALLTGRMMQAAWDCRLRLVRYVAAAFFAAAAVYSVGYNIQTLWSRYDDNRHAASAFIYENIPQGSTLGIKCLEEKDKAYKHEHFKEFMWDFPLVSGKDYKFTDCLLQPDYLVIDEYSDKYPLTAMHSDQLNGDVWPPEYTGMWWREKIPPPELMRLYRGLLTATSECYELIRDFPSRGTEYSIFQAHYDISHRHHIDWGVVQRLFFDPQGFFAFEYSSPEVRIFRKKDECAAKGGE